MGTKQLFESAMLLSLAIAGRLLATTRAIYSDGGQ